MMIEVLKSKIHCARVTEANLNYMGSITIDEDLLDAANMIAGEKVYIADNNNGERFETYIIKGERGSGKICLNGAAARKVQPDDTKKTSKNDPAKINAVPCSRRIPDSTDVNIIWQGIPASLPLPPIFLSRKTVGRQWAAPEALLCKSLC